MSMFNRPAEVTVEPEVTEASPTQPIKPTKPNINTIMTSTDAPKPKEKFNFFQTYDLAKFAVDKEMVLEEREKIKENASRDYQQLAKKAKRNRNYEHSSRISRILNWF